MQLCHNCFKVGLDVIELFSRVVEIDSIIVVRSMLGKRRIDVSNDNAVLFKTCFVMSELKQP